TNKTLFDPVLSVGDVSQFETNGTTTFTFTIYSDVLFSSDTTFNFTTADGSGVALADYLPTSGTATITAGTRSTQVNVTVLGNTVSQPNREFFLQISNPSQGTLGRSQGNAWIIDDDAAASGVLVDSNIYASIDDATNFDVSGNNETFTVYLNAPAPVDETIN